MEKSLYTIAVLTAAYAAIRYLIMRFIVTPITAKANAQAAKLAFQQKVKLESDEFARIAKEVADAKIIYDRAKRADADKSNTPR